MQQAAVEPLDGAVHAHPDQADDEDADEHDVEHEQLPALHHQVADTLAGSQQLDRQQRGPALRQGQAQPGEEGRERRRQDQPPDQQAWRQAQYCGGFAQLGLGVAHADQGMDGHRHHDRFHQHHQLEQFADAEEQHEQRDPGQRGDLREGAEGGEDQALGTRTEAQPGA